MRHWALLVSGMAYQEVLSVIFVQLVDDWDSTKRNKHIRDFRKVLIVHKGWNNLSFPDIAWKWLFRCAVQHRFSLSSLRIQQQSRIGLSYSLEASAMANTGNWSTLCWDQLERLLRSHLWTEQMDQPIVGHMGMISGHPGKDALYLTILQDTFWSLNPQLQEAW